MTATVPPQLRECRLYRFYGWNPYDGYQTKVLIYVGETAQMPFERLMQHVRDQPWADTITSWEVDDRVFASKAGVLAAERATVEAELPIYNYEWNQANPRRVPIPEARRQRWARDDAAGKPRWLPPSLRKPPPTWWGQTIAWLRRRPAWQVKAALWALSWLLLWAWVWPALLQVGLPNGPAALVSAVGCVLLLGEGLRRGGVRLKRRRRR